GGFAPARVCEVELSQPLPAVSADGAPGSARYGTAWVLARWYSEPLAVVQAAAPPPFLLGRDKVLASAPAASVIVCTRYRPDRLAGCLDALLAQDYPD